MIWIKTVLESIFIILVPISGYHNNFQALAQRELVLDLEIDVWMNVTTYIHAYVDAFDVEIILQSCLGPLSLHNTVLPKHTLFKVLYFILAKFKNYTLFLLFFSQIL